MAVRFFERIAKTYRRERWGATLRPLLTTWYKCAQQLGDVELSVKILVEMLAHGMHLLLRVVVADYVNDQVQANTKKMLGHYKKTSSPCSG